MLLVILRNLIYLKLFLFKLCYLRFVISRLAPANTEEKAFIRASHHGEQVVRTLNHGSKTKQKTTKKHGRSSSHPGAHHACVDIIPFLVAHRGGQLVQILPFIYWDLKICPKQLVVCKPEWKQLRIVALRRLHRLRHLQMQTTLQMPRQSRSLSRNGM